MNYLLDTNICIHFFKGQFGLVEKIRQIGFSECAISEITLAELYYGASKSQNVTKNKRVMLNSRQETLILLMSDRKNKNKMTDKFFIGHLNRTNTKVLHSKLWWNLTKGQCSADKLLYCTLTDDRKEKIKSPRFTFLKNFFYTHCTHLQSRTNQLIDKALQKNAILPLLKMNLLTLNQ